MTGPFADATLTALPATELLFWTVTFVVLAVLLWRVRDRKLDLPRVPLLILASFFWPVISFLTLISGMTFGSVGANRGRRNGTAWLLVFALSHHFSDSG